MRYLTFLLPCLILNVAFAQINTPDHLANTLTVAFRTLDEKKFEALLLDISDLEDANCAFASADKIYTLRENAMSNFYRVYEKILNTGLPPDKLKVEGTKVVLNEQKTLYIHVTLADHHGILELPYMEKSDSLKIFHILKLDDSPARNLRKYFNNESTRLFIGSLEDQWSFKKTNITKRREPSAGRDEESYSYYTHDTLQATIKGNPSTGELYVKTYYGNSVLKDSVYCKSESKAAYQEALSDPEIWHMRSLWRGWKTIYASRYWPNGNTMSLKKALPNDTIYEQSFYISGKRAEEKKSINRQVVLKAQYDRFGKLALYQVFSGKKKAAVLSDLKTFPRFEDVFNAYHNTRYNREPVRFHRKPDGWYIQLKSNNAQFLLWSFPEQNYVKLPDNPFNMYVPHRPSFSTIAPQLIDNLSREVLFSGYPNAIEEGIAFLEADTSPTTDQLSQLQAGYLALCEKKLLSSPVPDEELKSILEKFDTVSEKISTTGSEINRAAGYRHSASLYLLVRTMTNARQAAQLVRFRQPDLYREAWIKTFLNDCEQGSVLITDYEAPITYYQDNNNYRQDVLIIGARQLHENWYRGYIEQKLKAKKGAIFQLPAAVYKNHSINTTVTFGVPPVPVKDFLNKLSSASKDMVVPEELQFQAPGGEPIALNLRLSSVAEIELLNYLATVAGKTNVYGNLVEYFISGEQEQGVVLSKASLIKPQKGTTFSPSFLAKLNESLIPKLPDHLLTMVLMRTSQYILKNNNAGGKEAYTHFVNLYNKSMTARMYAQALEMVKYGIANNQRQLALQLLDKAAINVRDYCAQSEFYDADEIIKASEEMKSFLTANGFKEEANKYFEEL